MLLDVQMWELTKIVIPKLKTQWKKIAYCMRYSIEDVDAFDQEVRNLHERCEKLLTNWLTTSHGPTPKTYLEHIKEIDEPTAASKEIEEELIKGKNNNY